MATNTDTQNSPTTDRTTWSLSIGGSAREAFRAALDAVNRPTVDPCNPAGDWIREQDGTYIKIWRRCNHATETGGGEKADEQVVVALDGIASGWHVYHDTTDGSSERVTDDPLERDAAFRTAERTMERISGVRER